MAYKIQEEYFGKYRMAIWSESEFGQAALDGFKRSGCNGLRLSGSMGVKTIDWDAVGRLGDLLALEVYFIKTDFPSHILESLVQLELFGIDIVPNEDISAMSLESSRALMCTWSPHYPSIDQLPLLEYLNVNGINSVENLVNGDVAALERLAITDSKISSLSGIQYFLNISRMDIHHCRYLSDMSAVKTATRLREINITNCKQMTHFDCIFSSNAEKIYIEKCGKVHCEFATPLHDCLEELSIIDCEIDDVLMNKIRNNNKNINKIVLPQKYMRML